jgi:hypothetical protein
VSWPKHAQRKKPTEVAPLRAKKLALAETRKDLLRCSEMIAEGTLVRLASDLQPQRQENPVAREKRLYIALRDKQRPPDERLCAHVLLSVRLIGDLGQDDVSAAFAAAVPEWPLCELFHLGSKVGFLLRGENDLLKYHDQFLAFSAAATRRNQNWKEERQSQARKEFQRRRADDATKSKTSILGGMAQETTDECDAKGDPKKLWCSLRSLKRYCIDLK